MRLLSYRPAPDKNAPLPGRTIVNPETNQDAVLREQLDDLIDAGTDASAHDRNRLDRVAKILMEPFEEPVIVFGWPLWHGHSRGAA